MWERAARWPTQLCRECWVATSISLWNRCSDPQGTGRGGESINPAKMKLCPGCHNHFASGKLYNCLLGKFWTFDGFPNLMLKWIWCGSEGSNDDFYLKVVMMIHTLEGKVQLWPILCCVIRNFLPSVCTLSY